MTFHMLAQLLWFWPQPDMHSKTSPDFLFHSSSLLKVSQPAKAVPFRKCKVFGKPRNTLHFVVRLLTSVQRLVLLCRRPFQAREGQVANDCAWWVLSWWRKTAAQTPRARRLLLQPWPTCPALELRAGGSRLWLWIGHGGHRRCMQANGMPVQTRSGSSRFFREHLLGRYTDAVLHSSSEKVKLAQYPAKAKSVWRWEYD